MCSLVLCVALPGCGTSSSRSSTTPGRDAGAVEPVPTAAARIASIAPGAAPGTGTLFVTVSWPGAPAGERRSPGLNPCGAARPVPFLVHALGGVRGAVVVVEGAAAAAAQGDAGVAAEEAPAGALLAIQRCQLEPRVAVVSGRSAGLEVVNRDERLHQLMLRYLDRPGETDTTLALPLVGQRRLWLLPRAGLVAVTAALTPEDASYVLVTEERAAVTDELGRAELRNVPAGTYRVKVWLRSLHPGRAPVESTAQATVEAGRVSELEVPLGGAPPP
jgi:hypothetical protein